MIADRLTRMGEKDGVAVDASGLQGPDGEVLFGDGVGGAGAFDLLVRGVRSGVIGVDLLAHRQRGVPSAWYGELHRVARPVDQRLYDSALAYK